MKEINQQEKVEEMSPEEKRKEEKKKMSPQAKYRELISCIQILSIRASSAGNQEVSGRLRRIAKYLEEVRKQKFLCMLSETDREEKVRYNELLEYIDTQYDGTEESLKEICRTLDKRKEDIDEVLKYYDKKNNQSKEEER